MLTPEPTENAASFEDFLKAVEPRLKRLLAVYRIPGDDAEDVLICSPCQEFGGLFRGPPGMTRNHIRNRHI